MSEEVSKSSKVFVEVLAGFGIGMFAAFALIFAKHNPIIAITISIIYSLIQFKSFWRLFKEQQYVGMFGRFVLSSVFISILGGIIWGMFAFSIDIIDKVLIVGIVIVAIIISLIFSILKYYFPNTAINKKIQQTFAGLSAIGVLNSDVDK